MKSLYALASIGALSLATSTMANGPTTQPRSEDSPTLLEKKLTMSCFKNRAGDRMYVGEAETVTFCRKASRRVIADALEAEPVEIAAANQKTNTKVN